MRNLLTVIVLFLVGIAGLGYYRGWFGLSTTGTDQKPSTTFTMDEVKIHEDERKAKDKVQGFGQEAKEKFDGLTGKPTEPDRRP